MPGHARLRTRPLAQHLSTASGVVLTIDATTGLTARSVREAADHLQLILGLHTFSPAKPAPLLIVLAKSDLLSASLPTTTTIDRAKASLEREMERRRLAFGGTSSQKIEGLDVGSRRGLPTDEAEILAAPLPAFEATWDWSQLGVSVDWLVVSARAEGGLLPLEGWLAKARR